MNFSSIYCAFAKHFAAFEFSTAPAPPGDPGNELLHQLPESSWPQDSMPRDCIDGVASEHAGLYLGCPLSNDRHQLTSEVLLWCPFGWPSGNFESIVSSRLGNRLHQDDIIANGLRNFFLLTPPTETIVNGYCATLEEPVRRGCQLFSRRQLRLLPFPKRIDQAWIESTLIPPTDATFTIYFDDTVISVDEMMFALSDHVRILHSRPGGTIERLATHFQSSDLGPVIWQLVQDQRSGRNLEQTIDWYLCDSMLNKYEQLADSSCSDSNRRHFSPIVDLEAIVDQDDYLAHWTRAERASFPDQTPLGKFDTLFFGNDSAHSPLDTLCRIISKQKLLGSGRMVRGGQRVVCFTEVPVREFSRRRKFRPQLSRWDFELYGIAIRKDILKGHSGRKVEYIPKESDRGNQDPFHVTLSNNPELDWSTEREWRILGDLDLRQIPIEDAFVFVPDKPSAETVARLSRWPVVIIGGGVEKLPFRT